MNKNLVIILIVLVILAGGGFFVYQNLAQPGQPAEEKGTGEEEEVSLTRNYPSIIKAINEGPAMYGRGGPDSQGSITDESLEKMKETGFNTIQLLIIPEQQNNVFSIEPYSKSVLLNDIIRIKKANLAVWVALSYASGPAPEQKIDTYDKFKTPFLEFIKETSRELEEYKVEYFSVHNEPDLVFKNQGWGTGEPKSALIDYFPAANAAAREKFTGKLINKITEITYLSNNREVLDASLENVDIAAIDVGPPPNMMSIEFYKKEFDSYQKFANFAKEKNVPWMVGEYWAYDYFQTPTDYVKENQVKLAQTSFSAYLKTTPKGVGYTWNDFSTFSLQPNGEATRLAIKNFFGQVGQSATPAESPKTETPIETPTETPEVKSTNPIDDLSDALVAKWGADCKSRGSPLAIASCLLDWQENNIFWCYTNPEAQSYFEYFSPGYPDCVVDMQFQQMSPGSFPVSKVMDLKVRNGKIFGACYTYATTYCALARWHGLTCRVMEAKTTISFYSASSGDYAAGYCGSAPQTYLDKLGQSCPDWRQKNWLMDADHYWAEVLINGQWQIMERPTWAYRRDTTKYIIQAGRAYADTGW